MGRYAEMYARSLDDPHGFWGEAAESIHWDERWETVLDDRRPPFYRWFAGGVMNTCYNALDLHVESGRADQLALVYDSPLTGTTRRFTYAELLNKVARFAGVLAGHGVGKGDRVIIYMPMVPQAVIAMLACARIGAVHSVVFGGFAANELAVAHRRRFAQGHCFRVLRHRAGSGDRVQAAARPGDRAKPPQARALHRPAAQGLSLRTHAGPGCRLEGGNGRREGARLRPGGGHRSPVHPLHLGDHRTAEGRGARQRRPRGGAQVVDEAHLRSGAGRGVLGRLRRRLGGGPFLHRLCPAPQREHHHPLRGQAGGHAGRRCILAGAFRTRRAGDVYRAHRVSRGQAGGPGRPAHRGLRPFPIPHPVPCRRAYRPRYPALGGEQARGAGSSTTGGRPRRDGRSAPTVSGSRRCR